MAIKTIDAAMLKKCFLAGAATLESKKDIINELNVFPVPDGDTGTNMSLTIMSAANEVKQLTNPTLETLCKAISSGSLRGARGNSGVILSQLFRGFTKEVKSVEVIDAEVLARAFERATETAYKAVMKPKEGTILTVAKGAAEKMTEVCAESDDLEYIFGEVLEHAKYVLSTTPDLLPVLKQAGVVDSGGQGLVEVLSGAYDALLGKEIVFEEEVKEEPKFLYSVQFSVTLDREFTNGDLLSIRAYLESIGEEVHVAAEQSKVSIKVHTNDPGDVITKGLKYGTLSEVIFVNLKDDDEKKIAEADATSPADCDTQACEQPAEAETKAEPAKDEPKKPFGFISVSVGAGLSEIFEGLGVDMIIEGGQTMNPSTEDMLNAIDNVNAENVFILPNNSNIILAANQAKSIVTDKNIYVVPSKTVPQGITAIINFDESATPEENVERMTEEMQNVKTGQVTYAVRDTQMDGKEIKENDIMGIGDKTILSVGSDIEATTIDMLSQLIDEDSELVSVYYGSDVTKEQVDSLSAKLAENFPDVDLEVHLGGQPIYYYIVSVE